jgi:hypothetical protein
LAASRAPSRRQNSGGVEGRTGSVEKQQIPEWFPSRIAFGKFKGRDYRDARYDENLRSWLNWLAASSNTRSAQMGKWYLRQLEEREPPDKSEFILDGAVTGPNLSNGTAANQNFDIVLYVNIEVEQLKKLIAQSRSRLVTHYLKRSARFVDAAPGGIGVGIRWKCSL